ncbi:MAG: glutamate-5-semialdehyde dehydrogenase [Lachnospiraceae bacterium]|nr:glutamate-5-semialdehyde dehydrogenase [Lachnospiraceae bacterium]
MGAESGFDLIETGRLAKSAAYIMGALSTEEKNRGLAAVATALEAECASILSENAKDVENAKNAGTPPAMIDRLLLNEKRIADMALSVRQVCNLPDPVGDVLSKTERPNGLLIEKVRVPMGVIGIIYESRPNVTSDAFSLCFKTGNAVILRGGSDAINSNRAIVEVIRKALESVDITSDAVQLVTDTSRQTASEMMKLDKYIDLLIPRGGAGLIRNVVETATIPVIETGTGNCHIFVDESADINMAVNIIYNAKTQRMGVCNACESLLVHEKIAAAAIPAICAKLKTKDIEIRAGQRVFSLVPELSDEMKTATEEDFATEFLGPVISLQIVSDVREAVEHINRYTTHHSEAIITKSAENAELFLNGVDSACVYHNASTRFTDGFEFGFGAEIGISTQKLHARGPMGLCELTSYKYKVYGNGQVRG